MCVSLTVCLSFRERETDRQTDRQTETDRQTDRQSDRQTDRGRYRYRQRMCLSEWKCTPVLGQEHRHASCRSVRMNRPSWSVTYNIKVHRSSNPPSPPPPTHTHTACVHSPSHRLVGLVDKASAWRAEDPGFESHLRRDFSGSSDTSDFKNWHSSGHPEAPGVIGSALGLVGAVSVYCDWVR